MMCKGAVMDITMDADVRTFLNSRFGKTSDDAYLKCSDWAYIDMCRTIRFKSELKESFTNGKSSNKKQQKGTYKRSF